MKKNIQFFFVIDPKSCNSDDFENFETLYQIGIKRKREHSPGLYRDAPNSFCNDPSCSGCTNNKMVFKLLDEEVADENNQPVKGIDNGMLPEIPRVETEEERLEIFTKMLKELETDELCDDEVRKVKEMLSRYAKLFLITDNDQPGLIPDFEASIETVGEPISCKPRRFGAKAIKIMEDLNAIMEKKRFDKTL